VVSRRRDARGETTKERERIHQGGDGPVGEGPFEDDADQAVLALLDLVLRNGRASARDLANLNVAQTGTIAITLSAVADVIETVGPAEIRRAEGERVALITANLDGRDLGSAAEEIAAAIGAIDFPIGYDAHQGGQRQEMETSFQSLRFAILLAIFLVYLVMASQFESLLHPFVILFSAPFSLIGVVATLMILRIPLSVVVLIGVVLLAGIVVNNAIILIDYTNRLRARGLEKIEALRQAGQARLRPILMTTATTVLGLLPMAVSGGEGSELRSPMALTEIGGLAGLDRPDAAHHPGRLHAARPVPVGREGLVWRCAGHDPLRRLASRATHCRRASRGERRRSRGCRGTPPSRGPGRGSGSCGSRGSPSRGARVP
jgi:hypothetical protein